MMHTLAVVFTTILVCVDGSESSMKAANYAIEIAKKYKAKLISLYVIVSQLGYAYSSGAFGLVTPNAINELLDRKSTRLNSSHANISYAVFCLKKNNILMKFNLDYA